MPYKPPGPPEKTGKHRYVFLVFEPANATTQPLNLTKPKDRQHWGYEYHGERVGVRDWAVENGLIPVGKLHVTTSSIAAKIVNTLHVLCIGFFFNLINAQLFVRSCSSHRSRASYASSADSSTAANFIYAKNKQQ